ncbi:hypothetical protein J6T21_02805 [Candidatus Saccharibacteria bacterium]|nr:hypothetical protein [Candidatus Saccharibacteria bacterium]
MKNISNLVIRNNEAEARVIASVVSNVLQHEDKCPKKGSFVLCDTVDSSDISSEIVSFDLGRGTASCGDSDSRKVAEEIIQNDVHTSYLTEVSVILEDHGHKYMSLFASDDRRYICAFVSECIGAEIYVYAAVAQALSIMHNDDVLKASASRLYAEELEDHPGIFALEDYVATLFSVSELPAIRDWKASL